MSFIFGEFECKADAKGRFLMPAALLRQLPEEQRTGGYVMNRGLDKCLVLFTQQVWQEELTKIYSKNQFVAENRAFARMFQSGATPLELDSSNRLLVPRKLADYAGIDKELVLIGSGNKIEIWGKETFDRQLAQDLPSLAEISERVMANTNSHD